MQIITNNVPREIQDDWNEEGDFNNSFVIYKGERYDLDDFMSTSGINLTEKDFREQGWDGYISDTYFSGILLKWVPGTDWEEVIMGRYFT